eukprot:Sspe_Gene.76043::Locus_47512_Transcript_1_1_Confidence_1.000_Length_2233::g.76043::m.76043
MKLLSLLLLVAAAGSGAQRVVEWTGACQSISASNYMSPACWAGGVPTPNDRVLIAHNATMFLSGHMFTAREVVVLQGVELTLTDSVIQASEMFTIMGRVVLVGRVGAAMDQRQPLLVDQAMRALGLRDCASIPGGFTPRLCGNITVEGGGSLEVTGLYSSVFARVTVAKGGAYRLGAGAFSWEEVTVDGEMNLNGAPPGLGHLPVYWHGALVVRPTGVIQFSGLTMRDGYSLTGAEEVFKVPAVENHGTVLLVNGSLDVTYPGTIVNYPNSTFNRTGGGYSKWNVVNKGKMYTTGVEGGEVRNEGELVVDGKVLSGKVVNHGSLSLIGTTVFGGVVNHGTLDMQGGAVKGGVENRGHVVMRRDSVAATGGRLTNLGVLEVRGVELFAEHLDVEGGTVRLTDGGAVHLQAYTNYCWESVMKYCGCNDCTKCPSCVCCHDSSGGDKEGEWGTKDTPAGHFAGWRETADRAEFSRTLHNLVRTGREVPKPSPNGPFTFSKARIEGDGTGSLVTSAPLFLAAGGAALEVTGAQLFLIIEHRSQAVEGAGGMVVGQGGTVLLGLDSQLAGGGSLHVEHGGRAIIDAHSRVAVGNFSLVVSRGGEMLVDGSLCPDPAEARLVKGGRVWGLQKPC